MHLVFSFLQGFIGLAFGLNGVLKLLRKGPSPAHFEEFRYSPWFLSVVGIMEVVVGMGLLAGFWLASLVTLSACLLILIMVGAIGTHFLRKRETFFPDVLPATVGLVLALALLVFNW